MRRSAQFFKELFGQQRVRGPAGSPPGAAATAVPAVFERLLNS